MDDKYDVVIVGAGPAGCMVAYHLPKKFKILLIDRGRLPRHKACGGMLNPAAWEFVSQLKMPSDLLLNGDKLEFRFIDLSSGIMRR